MSSSISGSLQNDFNKYIYEKVKKDSSSELNPIKQALSDGKITKEEYNDLKKQYTGGDASKEADFDNSFMQTLGLSKERMESMKSSDNSPVEIKFSTLENGFIAVDNDNDLENGYITIANENVQEQKVATVGKTQRYDYNSQQSKDFKNSVGGLLKNDMKLPLGDGGADVSLNEYLKNNLGEIKSSPGARLSRSGGDTQIQKLQAYLGLPASRQDGLFGAETMSHLKSQYAEALRTGNKEKIDMLKNLMSGLNSQINTDSNTPKDKALQDLVQGTDILDSNIKSLDASKKGKEAIENEDYLHDAIETAKAIKDDNIRTKTLENLANKGAGQLQNIMKQEPLPETLEGDDRINLISESGNSASKATAKVFEALYNKEGSGDNAIWEFKPNPDKLKQITQEDLSLLPSELKSLVEKYNGGPVTATRQPDKPQVADVKSFSKDDLKKMSGDQVIELIKQLDASSNKSASYQEDRKRLIVSLAFKELTPTQQNEFKSLIGSESDDKKAAYIGFMIFGNKNNNFASNLVNEANEDLKKKIASFIDEIQKRVNNK